MLPLLLEVLDELDVLDEPLLLAALDELDPVALDDATEPSPPAPLPPLVVEFVPSPPEHEAKPSAPIPIATRMLIRFIGLQRLHEFMARSKP